jgi:hypothetical protein
MRAFLFTCLSVSLLTLFAVDQVATTPSTHSGTQEYDRP